MPAESWVFDKALELCKTSFTRYTRTRVEKYWKWLTALCMYPRLLRLLYSSHSSLHALIPVWWELVLSLRRGTNPRKNMPVVRSLPANTYSAAVSRLALGIYTLVDGDSVPIALHVCNMTFMKNLEHFGHMVRSATLWPVCDCMHWSAGCCKPASVTLYSSY